MTLLALAAAILAYVLGLSWIQSRIYEFYDFQDLIHPHIVDVFIAVWLVWFCSAIGSFLNVVAWRMPRGESINGRSHCPRCMSSLKTRDNFPVFGWIALLGRCRSCSLPISRRYPIVEALVGISMAVVGIAEIYSLAIPDQMVHGHGGPVWSPQVSPVLLGVLAYHIAALATLWGMALIRIDGTRLPGRLIVSAVVLVVLPMLAFPTLMIVPWQTTRPFPWNPDGLYFDAVMRVVTALVAAALFGRVLARGLCPTADLKMDPLGGGTARLVDLIVMLSIASLVVGWQSMLGLVIATAVVSVLAKPLLDTIPINDGPQGQIEKRGAMERFAFALPITLALHLVFWRVLWSFSYWPSDNSSRNVMIAAGALVLLLPLLLREPAPQVEAAPEIIDEEV